MSSEILLTDFLNWIKEEKELHLCSYEKADGGQLSRDHYWPLGSHKTQQLVKEFLHNSNAGERN